MTAAELLHRAALAEVTIYWDHKRRRAVMWSSKTPKPPAHLVNALEDRAEEINGLLSASGFWDCPCPQWGPCIKICTTGCATTLEEPLFYGPFWGSRRCR